VRRRWLMASDATRPTPTPPGLEIRWENAPPELTSRRIWCLWRAVSKDGEKPRKVPWRIDGVSPLKWSNPLNLSTFEEVKAAYLAGATLPEHSGNHFAGIGIVIPEKGDLKAFDLDEAIENSQIKPSAKAILDRINTYSETSPSRKGYHGIACATLPEGSENLGEAKNEPLRIDGQRIEFYAHSHFLTFTGHRLPEYPASVETRNEEMQGLYEELRDIRDFARATTSKPTKPAKGGAPGHDDRSRTYCLVALMSEAREVAGASEGARNNRLNEAALKLGHYVGAGILSRSGVESELLKAATASGLSEAESRATIRSGIEAGIAEPKKPTLDTPSPSLPSPIPSQMGGSSNTETALTRMPSFEDMTKSLDDKPDVTLSPTKAAKAMLAALHLAVSDLSAKQLPIWIYDHEAGIWNDRGEAEIGYQIDTIMGDLSYERGLRETTRRIRGALSRKPATFNSDPYLMPLENGVLDLRKGEFRESKPGDHLTFKYAARWGGEADYKPFLWFLCSSLPDKRDVLTVLDIITAIALRIPLDIIVLLIGGGSNGKGVLEKVILALYTISRATAIELEEIKRSRFGPGALLNRDVWIVSEVEGVKDAINVLKKISTGELLDADQKYAGRIQGRPHAVPILDSNKAFDIGDTTYGRKRRWVKIDFPYRFEDEPSSRPIDRHLEEKLTTPESLAGITKIIAARAPALIRSKKIYRRKSAEEMEDEYNRQRFSLSYFTEECIGTAQPDGRTEFLRTEEAYEAYREYCRLFNVTEVAARKQLGTYLYEKYAVESRNTSSKKREPDGTMKKIDYRYYPNLYLTKSPKEAYADHKNRFYDTYDTYTTDIRHEWGGESDNSNHNTTCTTRECILGDVIETIEDMFAFITPLAGESSREITWENYVHSHVVRVVQENTDPGDGGICTTDCTTRDIPSIGGSVVRSTDGDFGSGKIESHVVRLTDSEKPSVVDPGTNRIDPDLVEETDENMHGNSRHSHVVRVVQQKNGPIDSDSCTTDCTTRDIPSIGGSVVRLADGDSGGAKIESHVVRFAGSEKSNIVYPATNHIESELEAAKARISEKEAHFAEEAAKRTSQGQSSEDGLSDRALLQKAVKETAARWEKEGRPISLFRLAETIGAKDRDAVSAILMMAGYKQTDDRDDKGFKIWKKSESPPDGAGA
jgi:phage/plasmid-associated DNA primase